MEKLTPAIVQDHKTGEVLMLAYMNAEALQKTLTTGYTWFFSRSRQRLWQKGETSGNKQKVVAVRYDCDEDTYLVLVEQSGSGACHTGNRSCFYRQLYPEKKEVANLLPAFNNSFISKLEEVIKQRKLKKPSGSYTASLFTAGKEKILAKVAEESGEVIKAAQVEGNQRLIEETADLIYHLLVLLVNEGISLADVEQELANRHR
jgi:phosphoribosyl-ATP pyrophosphohydrolase/phosphoribosyl-AMP cyclohydrolase